MAVKILTAREAADLVPNHINLATSGFIGASFPEELALAIEKRFIETGSPLRSDFIVLRGTGGHKRKGIEPFCA